MSGKFILWSSEGWGGSGKRGPGRKQRELETLRSQLWGGADPHRAGHHVLDLGGLGEPSQTPQSHLGPSFKQTTCLVHAVHMLSPVGFTHACGIHDKPQPLPARRMLPPSRRPASRKGLRSPAWQPLALKLQMISGWGTERWHAVTVPCARDSLITLSLGKGSPWLLLRFKRLRLAEGYCCHSGHSSCHLP